MKKIKHIIGSGIFLLLINIGQAALSQDSLRYVDLIQRLYNMENLAIPPQKGEQSGNFSSFDRRSRYDSVSDTYIAWGANGDGSGYIRKEGNDIVVFEKDGPGVIWRFWSALAKEGHIKIYIDGNTMPVVDKPFREFFETTEGEVPPLNYPNMVMTLSRGRNHFLPIPYNKHCKIVLSENWGAYYHITYSNFPRTTFLPSYTGLFTRAEHFALAETDRWLGDRGYSRKRYDKETVETIHVEAGPGEAADVKAWQGNKAIAYIKVAFREDISAAEKQKVLEDLWISITWDDEEQPAVLTPLGLFFGTYSKVHAYRALPVGMIKSTCYSNWWMPFSKRAIIKLINKGQEKQVMDITVVTVPLPASADHLMRFHASFHRGLDREIKSPVPQRKDIVLDDFENSRYTGWTVNGNAFGTGPVQAALPKQSDVTGFAGRGMVNSFLNEDASTGTMVSNKFIINRRFLNFVIGGGAHFNKTGIQLLVDGKVVRSACGMETEQLLPASWDLTEFTGKQAVLKIIDLEEGGWGHIMVDQIVLSDNNTASTDGRSLDWAFLKVKGRGRFCGITLHIENTWEEPKQQSESWWYGKWDKKTIDWWWGEGDEKFFVDGEKFPSTFGTGSEDYIGYAWSAEPPFSLFDSPFASQPFTPINGNGHTIVSRFHIADNVPFQTSFEGYLEKYKPDKWGAQNVCLFDAVVYWYQFH
jgi:hypothetical protein